MYKPHLHFLLTALLFGSTAISYGQDILIKRSGDSLAAKVLKVTPFEVEYRQTQSTDTGKIVLPTTAISRIIYPNGVVDTFKANERSYNDANCYSHTRLTEMAKQDARTYYKGYRSAKTATTITTALSPMYGLILAGASAGSKPKYNTLHSPSPKLMANETYKDSYIRQAGKIKRREVWKGFGNGMAILGGVILAGISINMISSHH